MNAKSTGRSRRAVIMNICRKSLLDTGFHDFVLGWYDFFLIHKLLNVSAHVRSGLNCLELICVFSLY